jgi:L-lactate dehydrogenase complex protein LldG
MGPGPRHADQDLAERFCEELAALGGEVVRCGPAEIPGRMLSFLHEQEIAAIQAWEAPYLPADLIEALRQEGIQVSHAADPQIRLGLTGALAGIAETGSLVLAAGPGRPATASLLPEIHVALMRIGDLQERLAQALQLPEVSQASSLAIISGPSRTADIEMTLTIGVHGPRRLIVYLIDPEG